MKTFSASGGAGTVQFCVVLGWAGLRYQSSAVVLGLGGPVVPLWMLLVLRWIWRGLLSGRRASSTFPRLFGATPRP